MKSHFILVITTLFLASILAQAPVYTADSIVNTASGLPGSYAANTLVTITGQNLSNNTRTITANIQNGLLQTALPGTGMTAIVGGLLADLLSVSPTQVQLLIPTLLTAGPAKVQLEVNGRAGPAIPIVLGDSAPALFQAGTALNGNVYVMASHEDGSAVTPAAPAKIGEEIVVWATGLGATIPPPIPNQTPPKDAPIADRQHFHVTLEGHAVAAQMIEFVGAVANQPGLFRINLTIPEGRSIAPQILVGTDNSGASVISPPGRVLPVDPHSRVPPNRKPIPKPPRIIMY